MGKAIRTAALAAMASLSLLGTLMQQPVAAEPGDPGPYGLRMNYGYFKGLETNYGDKVFPNGISSNNVDEFIQRIRFELRPGAPIQYGMGASFIVQTMRGGTDKGYLVDPNGPAFADWEKRVRYVASYGGINFNEPLSFNQNSYYQQDHVDDAFYNVNHGAYWWTPSSTVNGELVGNSIVFRDTAGTEIYAIRRACANPVGLTTGLPYPPPQWYFDGTSFIDGNDRNSSSSPYIIGQKSLTVWPGDTVKYFHFGWNYGPDTGYTQWWAYLQPPSAPRSVVANSSGVIGVPGNTQIGPPANWNAYQIPLTAVPGEQYCQYIGFFWWAWNSPTGKDMNGPGQQACAIVGYNYSLIPQTANAGPSVASAGETVTFTNNMHRNGLTASRPPVTIVVKQFSVGPGSTVDMSQDYVDFNGGGCKNPFASGACTQDIDSYDDTSPFTATDTDIATRHAIAPLVIPGNIAAGSKVCRLITVTPPEDASGYQGTRWGRPACVTIGKYPTVQVYGGDVFSGGNFEKIDATCSTPAGPRGILAAGSKTFLSGVTAANFGEYGVFSLDTITGFSSGSAYNGNSLTFKNAGGLGSFYGPGANRRCLTDLDAMFRARATGGPAAPGSVSNISSLGNGIYIVNGDVNLSGANNFNNNVVLLVNGSVTLTDDVRVKMNAPGRTDGSLPRLVIAATGRIVINSNVQEVHAWLQSYDTLYTCDDTSGGGRLTVSKCNQPLTIYGLVSAKQVSLRRTGGGEQLNAGPAERFVMPPYAYLSSYADGQAGRTYRSAFELELPPRY